ncbi:DUF72 domain-containing protein [Acidicapsa ligni]|uniref:DUF72 domain-containing protein n=1 Tax=Acidicapsa ligni TaxID=542300 RepID=UPI0021DFC054|nr:DUF72 domain-containing protein [Acidicapsa ligni]
MPQQFQPEWSHRLGSHLQRYSRMLPCVEINSTFYRVHRATTWDRWAKETPADFRFSIKAPKTITHDAKLRDVEPLMQAFFTQIEPLGEKRGPVLFQLPPSLAFDKSMVTDFLIAVRNMYSADIVLEPRHPSWFNDAVDDLLVKYKITRVAADPPKGGPKASACGGDEGLAYYRLHGSPHMYYSSYDAAFLNSLGSKIEPHKRTWIIFDNTAAGHAYSNALQLQVLANEIYRDEDDRSTTSLAR